MSVVYEIILPAVVAPTVVTRRLTQVITKPTGDVFSSVVELAAEAANPELSFEIDDHVVLSLVDVDDHGRVSPSSPELAFDAKDETELPAPGELQVKFLRVDDAS